MVQQVSATTFYYLLSAANIPYVLLHQSPTPNKRECYMSLKKHKKFIFILLLDSNHCKVKLNYVLTFPLEFPV